MHRRAFLGLLSLTSSTIVAAQTLAPWELLQVESYSPSGRPNSGSTISYIKTTITDPNSTTNTTTTCAIEWDSLTKGESPYFSARECTPVEDGTWEFEVLQQADPSPSSSSSDQEQPSINTFTLRFTRFTNSGQLFIGSISLASGPEEDLSFMCATSGFCHAQLRPESTPLKFTPTEIGLKSSDLKTRQTDESHETHEEVEPEPEPPIPWQISHLETHRPASSSATGSSGLSSIILTITEPSTGFDGVDITSTCTLEWNEASGEEPFEKVLACSEVGEGYFMFEVVRPEAGAEASEGSTTIVEERGEGGEGMDKFNVKFTRLAEGGKTYLGLAEFEAGKNLAMDCGGGSAGMCDAVLKEEYIPLVVVPGEVRGR